MIQEQLNNKYNREIRNLKKSNESIENEMKVIKGNIKTLENENEDLKNGVFQHKSDLEIVSHSMIAIENKLQEVQKENETYMIHIEEQRTQMRNKNVIINNFDLSMSLL